MTGTEVINRIRLDLHSKRGLAGIRLLAGWLRELGADEAMVQAALEAKTAQEILLLAGRADIPLTDRGRCAAC